jgi:hypothetical protein
MSGPATGVDRDADSPALLIDASRSSGATAGDMTAS